MKQIKILVLAAVMTSILLACTLPGRNDRHILKEDEAAIADATFSKIIGAVKTSDSLYIVDMFSEAIQNENGDLRKQASNLLDFIRGDVVSYSAALESGVSADSEKQKGKIKKQINVAFTIHTTVSTYYVAIRECLVDEFVPENVGLLSVYIIEASDWEQNCVYRGDGKWTPGINIV